ncbi:MAG: TonB-dependent receptor [Steroidobacteraceae bacterium]|nr:TonB-dependent receptor [Steroidobacteraceae bacterium]
MTNSATARLAAAIALVLCTPAMAGDIVGCVVDTEGRPVPRASIALADGSRTTTADRSGAFRIPEVPEGAREITVTAVGYAETGIRVTVPATGAVEATVALENVAVLADVVVTGFRVSQMKSLQDKKASLNIKDSVTADDAGKLPDQNAAEALQRVPGVSIAIDQGEGRYVSIRGIDPALNNVTIDGQTIGAPESDRRIALDTIPTELLAKLEVIKSVTPDMDANAIGGAVNLITPTAFDVAEERLVTVSADVGYYDLNGESPYGAAIAYSQRLGAEQQFGVLLSASYSTRTYRSENFQGGAEWTDEGDFLVPDEYVLRDYELERNRTGIIANLDWRPSEGRRFYWNTLWNEFQDTEERQAAEIDYRNGDLLDQTPTSGTFTEAEGVRFVKYRREKQSILNTTLGTELGFGAYTVTASAGYGEAEQDTPFDNEWEFESDDEFPATYDTSKFFWSVDGGAPFADAAGYEFNEVFRGRQIVEEELTVLRADLRRELSFGDAPGYFKVGAKLTSRDKTSDAEADVFDGYAGDLTLDQVDRPGPGGFFAESGRYPYGPRVDYRAVEGVFGADGALFERSEGDSLEESLAADFEVTEDVTAFYLMAGATFGRLDLVGGIRYEDTSADYGAYSLVFEDGDLDPDAPFLRGGKDYDHTLPSLQARYALRDDLLLRAAWTNTIGRPAYESLVPFRVFEIDPDGDVFEGTLAQGNPDLEALESMNLDVSLEWYLQPAGLVSVGVFSKDIDNPIYTQVGTLEDVVFEGRTFSELEISQPRNAPSGELLGVEFNYQQQFAALPPPFDGLGVALNYTYTDGEATLFDRDDKVPFFLQPEHTGNLALFFEKSGFEARVAWTYRSEYLDEVSADGPEQDVYVDERSQLDVKLSYAFNPKWRVYAEFLNLTDEPLRYLNGNKRLAENELYSWNAVAGFEGRF